MFYGVEQSTDLRDRKTIIKKFTSLVALNRWVLGKSGNFTYENPEDVQNYHRTFRYGYELDGRVDKKDSIFKDIGTSTYPRSLNDNIALYLYKYGKEIK